MVMPRHRLRAHRERAGLTQREVATKLGVGEETYATWERGTSRPRLGFRPRLAELMKVGLADIDLALADTESIHPNGQALPPSLSVFASQEREAVREWAWEPMTVHGLLQTRGYAEAVERLDSSLSDASVATRVAARIDRQQVLRRRPALHLAVLMDASVLTRPTGSEDVMADQLGHLLDLMERRNIDLCIAPHPWGHLAGWGTFTVLTNAHDEPHLVCTSNGNGVGYDESSAAIDRHLSIFERLTEHALRAADAAKAIRTARERYQ